MPVTAYVKGQLATATSNEEAARRCTNIELQDQMLAYMRAWDAIFAPSFLEIRKLLAENADRHTAYPPDDGQSEWLLVRDDDDIHLPVSEQYFDQPADVVLVGFSSELYVLLPGVRSFTYEVNYRQGPWSNGYAIRRWFFNSLTPEQRRLMLGDHAKVHAYVHFVGYRYVLYPEIICGLGLVHPASMTAMQNFAPEKAAVKPDVLTRFATGKHSFVKEAANIFCSVQIRML